jgi:hypothetical protein
MAKGHLQPEDSAAPVSTDQTVELKDQLTVFIAEYQALRAEIQARTEYQHRFVQLHIGVYTVVLPVIVAYASAQSSPNQAVTSLATALIPWIVWIIPIESSVFGYWYVDHGTTIGEIGRYIQDRKESKVANLLEDDKLMGWEHYHREQMDQPTWRKLRSPLVLHFTFTLPTLLSLGLQLTFLFLVTPSPYAPAQWWPAFYLFALGFVFFLFYFGYWMAMQRVYEQTSAPRKD